MNSPYVEIIEQPASHALRFRYQCERRSAACIVGENSDLDNKTFPTIKVHGYRGIAWIIISCVTRGDPPKPHPYNLVGDSCEDGIYKTKVDLNTYNGILSFSDLSIQCVKKKQVREILESRKNNQIDPFKTGFNHMDFPDAIELSVVRLCFQVICWKSSTHRWESLTPVVSAPIYNKKVTEELNIYKLSACSAPASGGFEMILLCGKVVPNDIQVRFFEMRNNVVYWEGYGDFKPIHVHKKVAIVFKTPRYCDQDITEPVFIEVQLRKKTDCSSVSKSVPFLMLPLDADEVNPMKRKRMKLENNPHSHLLQEMVLRAQKQNNMMNQDSLYNYYNPQSEAVAAPLGGERVPRLMPNFQEINSVYQPDNFNRNIPPNQQRHFEGQGYSQAPLLRPRIPPQMDFLYRPQAEPQLQPQTQAEYQQQLEMNSITSDTFLESLSEGFSKGVSISDDYIKGITQSQNIPDLNRVLETTEQQRYGKFWRSAERREHNNAAGASFLSPIYENDTRQDCI